MTHTSDAINDLFAALAAAQGEMPTIAKTKQAKVKGSSRDGKFYEYSYAYADIADVLAAVLPVLSKHGLSVVQPTVLDGQGVFLATRLCHSSGQWIESLYPVCSIGGDHQKMGGAMTYARRYALCSLLGIAADEDTDGEGAERPVAPEKKGSPRPPLPPEPKASEPFPGDTSMPLEVETIGAAALKREIDRLRTSQAVTDFMLSPEVEKKLSGLPSDHAREDVRSHATGVRARLKEKEHAARNADTARG